MSILNRRAKVKARAVAAVQSKAKGARRHAVPLEVHAGEVPRVERKSAGKAGK